MEVYMEYKCVIANKELIIKNGMKKLENIIILKYG